jgi:chemotaxis protein MotB
VPNSHNEGANYFASMTDLLVGVLFVLIIMVAFLAFQMQSEKVVPFSIFEPVKQERDDLAEKVQALEAEIQRLEEALEKMKSADPIEAYMARGQGVRNNLVSDAVEELKRLNIDAEVGRSKNVITISGANLFASGRADLDTVEGARERVDRLAEVLYSRLECFTSGVVPPDSVRECNPDLVFLEAVYVEGHTDNVPISRNLGNGIRSNLELSARRATNTYQRMVLRMPELTELLNPADEQTLSVAAYGEQRPVAPNLSREGREQNRRIDIRFEMFVPESKEALSRFMERFE